MDADAFEKRLRDDGFDVLVRELEPGKALPEHEHPWDVRALILDGEFTVETAEGATTYRTGEFFDLPARVPHVERHGPAGARLLLGRRHHGD